MTPFVRPTRLPRLIFPALAAAALALAPSVRAGGGDEDAFGFGGAADPFASPDPLALGVHKGQDAVRADESVTLAVVLELQDHWHVNAHEPLEEWLIPTELRITDPPDARVLEIVYPEPVELAFSFSETPMAVYEGDAAIGVRLAMPADLANERVTVRGTVFFQACNDQTCLPPSEKAFETVFEVAAPGREIRRSEHPIFARIAFAPEGAAGDAPANAADAPVAPGDGGIEGGETPPAIGGETIGNAAQAAVTRAPASADEEGGVTAWLTRTIEGNFANPLLAGLLTLVAGLLSAATPCVYPMIPITARILMGRGGESPALGRMHAGMYFLGIILIYAILGLVASVTGGGFNEIMRIPWVILSFAILFALLGLSMLGLFEIQLPSSLATSIDSATSKRAGLLGTMMMGLGAGLVVSPCVGPVVFAILAQIANQIAVADAAGGGAVTRSGQLAYGGILMGAYGAGLGIPFLIVGLFSARAMVAKPGGWMTYARVALGIVILYFAFDYFHKGLSTAGVDRPIANAILGGVVLTFLSVVWGVFRPHVEAGPHAGWHKVKHAATILMLIVGVFYLWTGLSRSGLVPGGDSGVTARSVTGFDDEPAIEDSHGLTWMRDFESAQQTAAAESLPVFVDFYAHWCANCKVFSANAAKDGPLRTALESVVRAKVYDTDPIFQTFRNDPRYGELKRGLPFFLLLSSDGEFLWKGTDYRAEDRMVSEIEAALARERTQAARLSGTGTDG